MNSQDHYPESKTEEEVAAVQAQLDELGTGWRVVAIDGQGKDDPRAYFSASRPTPNAHTEVLHRNTATVVQLARETDLRLGAAKAVETHEGLNGTAA
jgi:hypothetical protein